jgi:Na+-translocating ferredoxin:NAD+ oxidoreductase RnfD subunit
MPEPTTTTTIAATTLSAAGITVPPLVLLGVNLGLRPDVLMAGFAGAIVAIVLLASVPQEGDTWKHLLRTTLRRMFVSVASALTAGYLTPLLMLPAANPHEAIVLGTAFAIGAGAQRYLRKTLDRITPPTLDRNEQGDAR